MYVISVTFVLKYLDRPVIKSTIFGHSTYVTAIRSYNKLPIKIKRLNGNQLKTYLKKWLFDHVYNRIMFISL